MMMSDVHITEFDENHMLLRSTPVANQIQEVNTNILCACMTCLGGSLCAVGACLHGSLCAVMEVLTCQCIN